MYYSYITIFSVIGSIRSIFKMDLNILNHFRIGKLLLISFSAVFLIAVASVIVANFAIYNVDKSQEALTNSSIPALINVNKLSAISFTLIQNISQMRDADSIEDLNTRRDKAISYSDELKLELNQLKNYNFPDSYFYEIEDILVRLENNIYQAHNILSAQRKTLNEYDNSFLILSDAIATLSDKSSIMKIDANISLIDKFETVNLQSSINNNTNNLTSIKDQLYKNDSLLEAVNRASEIRNSLHILNEANNNETILYSEQEFDHSLRIITRSIVNFPDNSFRTSLSPHLLLLIKHGQDNPDIFSNKKNLLGLTEELNKIDALNIQLTKMLNSSVTILSDEVKNKTDSSSHYLKDIISSGKFMTNAATIVATTVGILLMLITIKRVTNPLHKLVHATKEIGNGNLDFQIDINTKDEIGELARSFNDMTNNLKSSNDQIQYLAYHDTLTGLPNRRLFNKFLKTAILEAEQKDEKLAVMFMDLDNFKRINDSLGHNMGDELLKIVATRISQNIKKTDGNSSDKYSQTKSIVARIGGDEFILLFSHLHDSFQPSTIANRLLKTLSEPYQINNETIHTHASIGISVYPEDSNNPDDLIKYADIAMYEAKENGRGIYQYYSNSMNTAIFRILTLENKLHRAIADNQLELYYQPIFDAHSFEIIGAEALIRWNDPELGIVAPDAFIPLAEESGAIIQIGEWVIKEACKQLEYLNNKFKMDLSISVNVSGIQFSKQDLYELIANQLRLHKIKPNLLHIEITESILMSSSEVISSKLEALKSLGINISLDDFGTGYSSLSYIQKFPIDTLKIDRQFTSEICKSNAQPPLVSAIISMAHGLGLKVVAEGVEDEFQKDQLSKLECDQLQGYYFSRPIKADELALLIGNRFLKTA